jgi:hypothetical protein
VAATSSSPAGYHGAGWRVVERVSRDQGEVARDCAGKGRVHARKFVQVIARRRGCFPRLGIELKQLTLSLLLLQCLPRPNQENQLESCSRSSGVPEG